jgi:hypothetical protein
MSEKKRRLKPECEVHLFEAKPNKMFPEWMTQRLRFLRYSRSVKCAHCGKLTRHHWTMLLSFRVPNATQFVLGKGTELYPPLTPVCRTHFMAPEV